MKGYDFEIHHRYKTPNGWKDWNKGFGKFQSTNKEEQMIQLKKHLRILVASNQEIEIKILIDGKMVGYNLEPRDEVYYANQKS
jgi:hypothetical protein